MESLAVRAPRREGEAVRRRLLSEGLLRRDLRPRVAGDALLLPVKEEARGAGLGLDLATADFEPQQGAPPRYRELAQVPERLRPLLPTSFDVVGSIIVVKLPKDLERYAREVGAALLAAHKAARTVLLDRGVEGEERVRRVEPIAGEPTTVTEHVEYGLRFRVDLARAYFSPRLAGEHHRVAGLVEPGEVLLDLFAGVGPFAIHAARTGKPRLCHAVDANPDAARLLEDNVHLNRVADRVRVIVGDADEAARGLAGQCDRVVMNLPQSAHGHWEAALAACKPEATIHYHRILGPKEVEAHATMLAERARRAGFEARLAGRREVRAYSPGRGHWALDVALRRRTP